MTEGGFGYSPLLCLISPDAVHLLNTVGIQSTFEIDLFSSFNSSYSAKFSTLNRALFVLLRSVRNTGNIDETLQQCFQCQDTVSLYRLILRSIQESLQSDKEKGLLREVSRECINISTGNVYPSWKECFLKVNMLVHMYDSEITVLLV